MHANMRRGLLSTLFAGGLLALGTTAASAADTTSGSDGLASGTQVVTPVTAPITVGTTSLGLLGDSTATTESDATTAPAGTTTPAASTNGSDGLASGTQVVAPVTAPITLGTTSLGLLGDSTATTESDNGGTTAPAGTTTPAASTNGSDGLASGTQVVAPVTAPITLGTTSLGLLGDSTATTEGDNGGTTAPAGTTTPAASTNGSDGLASGTQVVAPVTAPITLGTTSLGLLGDSTATTESDNGGTTAPAGTTTPAASTNGSDGLASGTQVVAPVTAPITVGTTSLGLLGDSTATTEGDNGGTTAPAGTTTPAASTNGSDGLASGTQVVAPVTAPITLGTTSLGLLGDSTATTEGDNGGTAPAGTTTPAASTNGSDGLASGTQVVAPISLPVTIGGASVGIGSDSSSTVVPPVVAPPVDMAPVVTPPVVTPPLVFGPAVAPPVTVTEGPSSLAVAGTNTAPAGIQMAPAAAGAPSAAPMLANTGANLGLVTSALLLLAGGMIIMFVLGRRKKA
ncbi:conserved hypothetical protein [Arthrobacter sp. FB24]|uniref:hypothetical protein n=1 Tax=Arthrobacter sp. (strain FB24) TaxID=290399 RepID=UPI0000527794|nr:hypothetical protein [Arthrobacter sp. FB24]ABK02491.1 conserved hypothetical protein [Arthrobacter sp. FB24]